MNAQADHDSFQAADAVVASAGEQLRAARESHGLSIADVAYALKLNPRQVEALETDRFDLLPGRAFARGFLKNYAKFLGLDAEPLLAACDQSAGARAMELAPVSNAQGTMPSGDVRLRPSALPAALVAFSLVILVAAGWYFDWFQQPEAIPQEPVNATVLEAPLVKPEPVPSEPHPQEPPAPVPSSAATPAGAADPVAVGIPASAAGPATLAGPRVPEAGNGAAPAAAVAADSVPKPSAAAPKGGDTAAAGLGPQLPSIADRVAGQHSLVFRFAEDAWVEVRDGSGRMVMARIGKAGTSEELQGKPPFSLVIGNAGKVQLEHDGKVVDLAPHTRVSVARMKIE